MSIIAGTNSSQRVFTGQRKDFIVMRKDTFEYTGTYSYVHTDGATVQYDFTGCIGMMHIKKKKTDTVPLKSIGISFDIYDYTLNATAENMDLDAGRYYYDLQIYDADNKMVTKLYGNFIVLQDVTDFTGVVELYPSFDIQSEVLYTFDDFKKSILNIILNSEVTYNFDSFAAKTLPILPLTEITFSVLEFITAFNLIDIKSEISYTHSDFIYLPMNIYLESEASWLQQYVLSTSVLIYSEITYSIESQAI